MRTEPTPEGRPTPRVRSSPFSSSLFRSSPLISSLILLATFLLAAPGVLRYGLTWDEPTYFHFAGQQRDWIGQLAGAVLDPGKMSGLLSRETIEAVWLQHPEKNGHPPLNETWMGLAGAPFRLAGAEDLTSFRLAISVLLAITTLLLFRLLRQGLSPGASLVGTLAWLGVPAAWAHGHLGATETIQAFFWVLFALLLPRAMAHGSRWLWIWLLVSAMAFLAKFTNILIPVWVLGTAGLLGAWRYRRFWVCACIGFVVGPALILVLDPFFWPWQGGLERFADYLRQTTTRDQWMPINVFYLGKNWGFSPPWHYRIVETAVSLPTALYLLILPGLVFAGRASARSVRRGFFARRVAQGVAYAERPRGTEQHEILRGTSWPSILGLTGLLFTFAVGVLPGSPNHDGTRQFVYVFLMTALLAGSGAEGMLRVARRASTPARRWVRPFVQLLLPVPVIVALATSLAFEPWGLSYHNALVGGARGAHAKGFELSYWSEAISPAMLAELEHIAPRDGQLLRVHTIPKLNYFAEAEPFIRPLLPEGMRARRPIALDVPTAFLAPWAEPVKSTPRSPVLMFSFPVPLDAIVISYRRAMVSSDLWGMLEALAARGDLVVAHETRIDGVPVARLYRIPELRVVTYPEDPTGQPWFTLPTLAAVTFGRE